MAKHRDLFLRAQKGDRKAKARIAEEYINEGPSQKTTVREVNRMTHRGLMRYIRLATLVYLLALIAMLLERTTT